MSGYNSIGKSIDWITATAKPKSEGFSALYKFAKGFVEDRAKQYGALIDTWSFYGYQGFIIRENGHLAYGERTEQGNLIQAGGDMASQSWQDIAGVADNITRFDICVDVLLNQDDTTIARVCYDWVKQSKVGVRNRKYGLIQGNTGDTLYVGSRQSTQFGRVYDKSGQMGLAAGRIWRYELELKGKPAWQMASVLLEKCGRAEDDPKSLGKAIVNTVYHWFSDRMVEPLFEHNGKGIAVSTVRATTALDQKLTWLRKQVRPSVLALISRGYEQEVIDALGLMLLQDEMR